MIAGTKPQTRVAIGQPDEEIVKAPSATGVGAVAAVSVAEGHLERCAVVRDVGELIALAERLKHADSTIEDHEFKGRARAQVGKDAGSGVLGVPVDVVLQLADGADDLLRPSGREASSDGGALKFVPELGPGGVGSIGVIAPDPDEAACRGGLGHPAVEAVAHVAMEVLERGRPGQRAEFIACGPEPAPLQVGAEFDGLENVAAQRLAGERARGELVEAGRGEGFWWGTKGQTGTRDTWDGAIIASWGVRPPTGSAIICAGRVR